MNRWKASGSHLLLSILVIGGIALSAFLLWYPHALYRVAGLDRILLVMLGIDLTAGPLLTLILYRKGKWGLKFDLTVIAICQLAFLAYGLHTLWAARPVFLVGTPDTFTLVFASEISDDDLAQGTRPEWRRLSWTGPVLVGTRMPDDPEQRRLIIDEFMAGGAGVERSPKYYLDFAEVAPEMLRKAARPDAGAGLPITDRRDVGATPDDLRLVPIVSRRDEGRMLVDATSGRPVRTITP
ncbi:hypothetical protein [Luteimonas saliphila]|uniref:hypothetical protein n=1 Tax=Luteimonas saliphila TaxID=2804919 RepID=UPI00192D5EA6|nr:hypothetical protein [Luteimonas saliphila]